MDTCVYVHTRSVGLICQTFKQANGIMNIVKVTFFIKNIGARG